MASNFLRRARSGNVRFILLVALGLSSIAFADDGATESLPRESGKSYFFSYDEEGELAFTQILSWQGDANALSYEVEVRDSSGKTLVERATDETSLEVSLAPGEYSYRVRAINLLGKRESVGPWFVFTVKRAIKPEVDWISPNTLYPEGDELVVTVGGTGFADGLRVRIVGLDGTGDGPWGEVAESSRERIKVSFSSDLLGSGEFRLKVVNPSGLSGVSRERLTVAYREKNAYYVSAGYSPFVAVLDPWYTDLWDDVLYPAGFTIRGGYLNGSGKNADFGFEARLACRFLSAERDSVTVDENVFQMGVGFVYTRELRDRLSFVSRLGAGIALTVMELDIGGIQGGTQGSLDPASYLGAAVRYRFRDALFAEFGTDFEIVFHKNFVTAGFTPSLSVGYLVKP